MKLQSTINRLLFLGAGLLFLLALVEKLANANGYTLVDRIYAPGRMLEFSAIMVLFVVALLLREIREKIEMKI